MTSAVNSAASIALAVGTESALADMAVFREGIRGLTAEIAQLAAVAKAVDISASLKKGLTGTSQSFTAEAEKANAGVAKTLSSGAGQKTAEEFGGGLVKGVKQSLDQLEKDASKTAAKIRASFSVPLGNGARATQSVAIDSASPIGQALAAKASTALVDPAATLAQAAALEEQKKIQAEGRLVSNAQTEDIRRSYAAEVQARQAGLLQVSAEMENERRVREEERGAQSAGKTQSLAIAEDEKRRFAAEAQARRAGLVQVSAEMENERVDRALEAEQRKVGLTQVSAQAEDQARRLSAEAQARRAGLTVVSAEMENERLERARERETQAAGRTQVSAIAEDEKRRFAAETQARKAGLTVLAAEMEDERRLRAVESAQRASDLKDARFQTAPLTQGKVSTVRTAAAFQQTQGSAAAEDQFGKAVVATIPALPQLESELERLGLAHQNAGAKASTHTTLMKAARSEMDDLHSTARGLAGSLNLLWATWGSVVPIVAAAAIGGALVGVLEKGKAAEQALAFIPALTGQVITLSDALKATQGSIFTPEQGIEGLRALTQAGFDAKQSLLALPEVMKLAQVGQISVGEAAKVTASAIHGFGLELADAGHVGDVFVKAAASSNQSVEVIADAMRQASTVAAQYKISLEEAAATISVLEKRNISGSQSFTEIRTALKDIVTPSQKAKNVLDQLGVNAFNGKEAKGFGELMDELQKKVSGLNEKSQELFLNTAFDSRAAKGIGALIAGWDEYKKKLAEVSDQDDFLTKAQASLGDTSEAAFKRAASALDNTFVKAFQAASPAVQSFLNELARGFASDGFQSALSNLVVGITNLTREISSHIGLIGGLVLAYAGVKIALGVAGLAANAAKEADAAWTAGKKLLKGATDEATVAIDRESLAKEANAAKTATSVTGLGKYAAATTTVVGALSAVIGVVSVVAAVIAGLVAVYELLSAKSADAAKNIDIGKEAMEQSIAVINEETASINRQIASLREQRGLKDEDHQRSLQGKRETSDSDIATKRSREAEIDARLKAIDTAPSADAENSIDVGKLSEINTLRKERAGIETSITAQLKLQKEAGDDEKGRVTAKGALDDEKARAKINRLSNEILGDPTEGTRGAIDFKKIPADVIASVRQIKADADAGKGSLQDEAAAMQKLAVAVRLTGGNINLPDKTGIRLQNEAAQEAKKAAEDEYNTKKRIADIDKQADLADISAQEKAHTLNPADAMDQRTAAWNKYTAAITAAGVTAVNTLAAITRGDKQELVNYYVLDESRHLAEQKSQEDELERRQKITAELKSQLAYKEQAASFEGDIGKIHTADDKRLKTNANKYNDQFLSNADKAAADATLAVAAEYETLLEKINKELTARRALSTTGDNDPAIQGYLKEIDALKKDEDALKSNAAAAARAQELRNESFGAGVEKAFANYAKAAEDKSKIAEGFVTSSIDRMTGALNDFANGKKVSLKNLFKDEAADIIKVQLKVSTGGIAKQIQDAIGGPNGNGSGDGGFIGQALSVLFGGTADSTSNTWGIPGGLTSLTGGKGAPGGAGGSLGSASQTTAKDVLTFGQALRQVTASMGGGVSVGGVPLTGAGSVLQNSQLNSATSGGIIGALFGKAGNALATSWNLRGGQSALGSTTSTPGGSINNAPAGTSYDAAYAADVPIGHTGGIIGGALRRHAPVSMAHFAGAPRYHGGGIVSGEVPLIGKEGEGIFTREQMANLAPAGKPSAPIQHSSVKQTNNFIVKNAPSRQSQSQMVSNVGRVLNRRQLSRSS